MGDSDGKCLTPFGSVHRCLSHRRRFRRWPETCSSSAGSLSWRYANGLSIRD